MSASTTSASQSFLGARRERERASPTRHVGARVDG